MVKIEFIIDIAMQAGEILMKYYNNYNLNIDYKKDASPVTCADIAANEFICESIKKLYPMIPIISEEDQFSHVLEHNSSMFWSVDPLDATKSFIKKDGEFTVNIALIDNKLPKFGVVYAPLSKKLYFNKGNQAFIVQDKRFQSPKIITTREIPQEGATVLVSTSSINKNKIDQFLNNVPVKQIIPVASSLKICLIAEGEADFYPRFGKTMEWDTAAAHAILNAAGGSIRDLNGYDLRYGHREKQYYNPEFIAFGAKYAWSS